MKRFVLNALGYFVLSSIQLQSFAQVQSQPNPDSVRQQRARMIKSATEAYEHRVFTHQDSLRGSVTLERAWWDVLRYDISIQPDFEDQSTRGSNEITYKVLDAFQPAMQIDLKAPLSVDSIIAGENQSLNFTREGNVWHVHTPKYAVGTVQHLKVYFHGHPVIAVRPPWDGGWTFTRDEQGNPWMTVCCQGMGASLWYPCKDHQSDEPDQGASLTMIAADSLVAVAGGHLVNRCKTKDGLISTKYEIQNPISNYCIIPYIGKYDSFKETYPGLDGPLHIEYDVLPEHLKKARTYLPEQVHYMLKSMEYWFGPYPFYKDGYKLVEVQHTGMEHQSAVAYGNHYGFGYRGRDLSGTGWGSKWDFIIVHESGHEWFGNNITTTDLADMWVHESFANYSETLYVEYRWGKAAGNEYNFGIRKNIVNDRPVIPRYGVNESGSGDMYYKGSNMLHAIRHSMNNDSLFRKILIGLNRHFYHQTVTGQQIQDYISKRAGFNYQPVFDQYLTTTQIPVLQLRFNADSSKVEYRWHNCIDNFNLPLALASGADKNSTVLKLYPTTAWQRTAIQKAERALVNSESIIHNYYIETDFSSE